MPGFDIEGAVARLNGNRTLHAELLSEFAVEHGDCTSKVARALAALRPREAVAVLHRMKGAAVVVGAMDIAEAAAAAENEIAHGARPPLDALHDLLRCAVEGIRALRAADRTPFADALSAQGVAAPDGDVRKRGS